ncbi:MAG TPA: SUMF1/EgtB/PvdO family nonheme iron enzyme [Candidatus Omnitrophota bacterium]|nr:SUMF1/EgtB/PvdO family nonheme iron enzyme [Candidatus Omnitrophota bacterium]
MKNKCAGQKLKFWMMEDLSDAWTGWLHQCVKQAINGSAGLFILIFIFAGAIFANDVQITNAEIKDQNTSGKTAEVEFDLSWQNAWSDSVNHDAVWIFFKYSSDGGTTWNHATMKNSGTNPSGFSYGSRASGNFTTLEMVVPADKKGVFIKPGHLGSGYVDFDNLNVVWDYGADGPNDPYTPWVTPNASFQIRAHAIEMVYIPEEGFYLGDGSNGSVGQFEFGGSTSSLPGVISSEEELSFGTAATQWYYNTDNGAANDVASGSVFQVSESFPKGFQAFYLMKYEITEGQYVDFLNSLLRPQQNRRVHSDTSGDTITYNYVMENYTSSQYRNTIRLPSSGSGYGTNPALTFYTDRPDRATAFLTWMDLAAYADWAALRPITELEFEKAARGPLYPVTSELAWGNSSSAACATIDGVAEDGTEYCYDGAHRANYDSTTLAGLDGGQGPVRAGFFAQASFSTRYESGAGYYGNMELSGNVWEQVVTLGNAAGRGFSGTHGDGRLTGLAISGYEGNATNSDWPGINQGNYSYGAYGADGSGWKGGGWDENSGALQVSNRYYAAYGTPTRHYSTGGRVARTADNS